MVTKSEIVQEIAKLFQHERRELLDDILGMEPEADVYAELTRAADEAFLLLDELENQDAETSPAR